MIAFEPSAEAAEAFAQHCHALSDILLITQETLSSQYRAGDNCAKAEPDALEAVFVHTPDLVTALRTLAMRYDRASLIKFNGRVDRIYKDPER